jgi:hypothetical protein
MSRLLRHEYQYVLRFALERQRPTFRDQHLSLTVRQVETVASRAARQIHAIDVVRQPPRYSNTTWSKRRARAIAEM